MTGRSIELLQAVNEAAASFQRSTHSESAVFRGFTQQLANLHLRGGLSLLDDSGTHLVVQTVNYPGRIQRILRRIERVLGMETQQYRFAAADVDVYQRVIETGETQYVPDTGTVLVQMVPAKARRLLSRLLTLFTPDPGIYAPLILADRVQGVINIVGPNLTPEDKPALTAFANHIAVALENARLFEKTRQHAAELEQRVAERTRELAAANERLQSLDALKSQLISNASHELRAPITNLELYLELIQNGDPEKREHYFQIVLEQSRRMKQLVEDMLDLSRLEAGRDRLQFSPVQLNKIVGQVVTIQQARAQHQQLALRFEPADALPPVLGIASQLSQLVVNLVTNSMKYTTAGAITLSTWHDSERQRICLQVADTGCGIAAADLPYIFDRFYRGRNRSESQEPGTGLGLSIVSDIVHIHGGEIDVDSAVGEGTTVRVWLPARQSD